MAKKGLFERFRDFAVGPPPIYQQAQAKAPVRIPGSSIPVAIPSTRVSVPNQPIGNQITGLKEQYRVVNRDFVNEVIPLIRKLVKINPDFGQALNNIVTLGNTGHKICFDANLDPAYVQKMRNHLTNKKLIWAAGQAGMDGFINKMFAQLMIGGALSNEWVPMDDLTGIETVILVNPEDIDFILDKRGIKYEPYQRVKNGFIPTTSDNNLIKLNPNTYRYYALNGDTEVPYGFPPYMTALERTRTQNKMNTNIDFVIDQLGLLGFLHATIGKPEQLDGEKLGNYDSRLDKLLGDVKNRIGEGMKDGVVVGFKDDAEFEFHSYTRALQDAIALFESNELQVASGLKQDATLWGRNYNSSETQITVVFIKMLSELRNIQNIVKTNLEYGYSLELTLAGFKFDYLGVEFNKSTLQDDLKWQQAQEIKVRNVQSKMILGIIDQDQAADELGYEAPAFDEPMVDWEILAGGAVPVDPAQADSRQKGKGDSAKKGRAKKKAVSKDYK